jgi:hypothetical protein
MGPMDGRRGIITATRTMPLSSAHAIHLHTSNTSIKKKKKLKKNEEKKKKKS